MKFLKNHADDLLITAGCSLILMGSMAVLPVLGWFVGGVELIAWGIMIGIAQSGRSETK